MHEFVLSGAPMKRDLGIRTLDLAKRLLDHGFHPPTVYFPLLVDEALLVEPTETETRETLDAFAEALAEILREAAEDPEIARNAPYTTPVRRLDEARRGEAAGDPPAAGRRGAVERLRRSRSALARCGVRADASLGTRGGVAASVASRARAAIVAARHRALRGRRGEGERGSRRRAATRPPPRPCAGTWTLCGRVAGRRRERSTLGRRSGGLDVERSVASRREHDSRPPEPRLGPRRPGVEVGPDAPPAPRWTRRRPS